MIQQQHNKIVWNKKEQYFLNLSMTHTKIYKKNILHTSLSVGLPGGIFCFVFGFTVLSPVYTEWGQCSINLFKAKIVLRCSTLTDVLSACLQCWLIIYKPCAFACLTLYQPPYEIYVYTVMHVVLVCFNNPPNSDMDYRIFNVRTWTFSACVYTQSYV